MTIPAELTEFVPEKVDYSETRSWELKTSDCGDHVEIRNLIFSRKLIGTIVALVTFMAFVTTIAAVMIFMSDTVEPILKPLVIAGFASAGFFVVGIIIVAFIASAYSNASLWKAGLRFQYTKSTGEIFFPRENVRYSRDDYDELVLRTTDGYDIAEIMRERERNENSSSRRYSTPTLITQAYFLVHRKDDTWTRHLIAYEKHSESARKGFVKIQEAVQCQNVATVATVATRTMSQQESYATQHKTADPEAKLTKPPKPMRFGIEFYGFMSLFVLFGFGFIGICCSQLYNANASLSWSTTEGTITRSGKYESEPDISYDYTVEGKKYTGRTCQYGALHTSERTKKIVAQYPVGAVVKVYYSPQSPEKSVLIPGAGVGAYIGIGFGIMFALIAVGAMFLIPFVFRSVDSAMHRKFVAPPPKAVGE
jgi:hypothetical protein